MHVRQMLGLAFALTLAGACSSSSSGGSGSGSGGSGGAAEAGGSTNGSSGGAGDNTTCGQPGGPACSLGTPCDPNRFDCVENSGGSLKCQTIAEDCTPLAVPVCGESTLSCATQGDFFVCACSGKVIPRDCAIQNSRIAPDASFCSVGVFDCGGSSCRQHLDVCVNSALEDDPEPHCEEASERGCGTYDIADCRCLDTEEGQACRFVEPGHVEIFDEAVGEGGSGGG